MLSHLVLASGAIGWRIVAEIPTADCAVANASVAL
jgi:hypothetical protein